MQVPTKIVVVGSLNIDYYTRVPAFPRPGETALADRLEIRFGGKGANQAVAASRLEADVEMIGCLGDDEMGERYLQRLREFGIACEGVCLAAGLASGSAFITLDSNSENTIVVAPGANQQLDAQQVETHADRIAGADCLLLQNEVPPGANAAAMAIAMQAGTRILYNPAPWREGSPLPGGVRDCVIVNETEAEQLLGSPVESIEQLTDVPGIVVTRGAASTLANIGGALIEITPPTITPTDTVGAGDTFVGALAVFATPDGVEPSEALRMANAAAALATQRRGAQEGMPTRRELARFVAGA